MLLKEFEQFDERNFGGEVGAIVEEGCAIE
jgi:hypothetical protein